METRSIFSNFTDIHEHEISAMTDTATGAMTGVEAGAMTVAMTGAASDRNFEVQSAGAGMQASGETFERNSRRILVTSVMS